MTTTYELDSLSHLVASDGIDAHAGAVARLAADGIEAEVSPVLLGVLTDGTEPTVVRQRAFGRVAAGVGRYLTSHYTDRPEARADAAELIDHRLAALV